MMVESGSRNKSINLLFPNVFSDKASTKKYDQYFFGHGKVLLSGEYFILDGADGLALPTTVGQSMGVCYSSSFDPKLTWRSYDARGNLWFESSFEFWRFDCLEENPCAEVLQLQKILRAARSQNKHFLRDGGDILVETHLGFPLEWGLGSSSTLIYNIAQWAYISPFELAFNTFGGSGYDIACAQSDRPILYQKKSLTPKWSTVSFDPQFKDNLYFIHQGAKKDTREAIDYYNRKRPFPSGLINSISDLTRRVLVARSLDDFNQFLREHEMLVADHLNLTPLKKLCFSDFWGEVKSLGAWGGDLALITSDRSREETHHYFESLGFKTVLGFNDLILKAPRPSLSQEDKGLVH